jgi:uncharacterized protein YfaP (DUF2135 family)
MKRLVLLFLVAVLLPTFTVLMQEPALILTRGTLVTGTLDAESIARVYFFVAVADERIDLVADGEGNFGVGLLLTAPDGTVLGQAAPNAGGETALRGIVMPTTANFYVTVFAFGPTPTGDYRLLLNTAEAQGSATPGAEATPEASAEPATQFGVAPTPASTGSADSGTGFVPSSQVLLANGISVTLNWNADVDLNLEVRDPLGNTLYFDSRTSPIGGSFGFDANGFCQVISPNPAETATWAPGFLPTGSYEILVFYRQACSAPNPVTFTISVAVNGQQLTPVEGTLTPPLPNQNSVYLSSFRVNADTSAEMNVGGVYPDSALNIVAATPSALASSAVPLLPGASQVGAIYLDDFFRVYQFEARANELVTISATATSGSLDTLLQITDANGNLLAVNDDANGTRNSQIANFRLANAGTYYAVVTRYGKEYGGSEGEFELLLNPGVAQLPAEVLALNLTPGDVQVVITWSTRADVQLLVRDPIGDSVFDDQPSVASGGILGLNGNVNCTVASGTPASYVYWPQNVLRPGNYEVDVWYQNACGDNTPLVVNLSIIVRGQIITVEQIRPALDQHYVIAFTVNPDGTAVARLGGFATSDASSIQWQTRTATPILPNQAVIGTISDTNVFDTYSFTGTAGQRVVIVNASTTPTLDTKLFLMDPNGVQIAENDDAGTVSPTVRRSDAVIANVVLPEDGTYTIIATRYATIYGGTTGSYTLTLSLN